MSEVDPITAAENRLLRCPFCQGKAELVLIMSDQWKAQCLKCGSSSRASTSYEFTVNLWNRRA